MCSFTMLPGFENRENNMSVKKQKQNKTRQNWTRTSISQKTFYIRIGMVYNQVSKMSSCVCVCVVCAHARVWVTLLSLRYGGRGKQAEHTLWVEERQREVQHLFKTWAGMRVSHDNKPTATDTGRSYFNNCPQDCVFVSEHVVLVSSVCFQWSGSENLRALDDHGGSGQ